jgi:hypothetical protein
MYWLFSATRFSTSGFFHESVSLFPKTLIMPLGPFRIVLKIRGYIRSSRCTTCVIDPGGAPGGEKIRNDPNVIFRGLGKMIYEKNLKQKIS